MSFVYTPNPPPFDIDENRKRVPQMVKTISHV